MKNINLMNNKNSDLIFKYKIFRYNNFFEKLLKYKE